MPVPWPWTNIVYGNEFASLSRGGDGTTTMMAEEAAVGLLAVMEADAVEVMEADAVGVMEEVEEVDEVEEMVTEGVDEGGMRGIYIAMVLNLHLKRVA